MKPFVYFKNKFLDKEEGRFFMKKGILKKTLILALSLALSVTALSGCGRETGKTEEELEVENRIAEGFVYDETSRLGIDSNSKSFVEKLTDNTFYVVHEGIYYPAYTYYENELAKDELSDSVNEERMIFYTIDNYSDIPTLYPGDHLVYYSTEEMLDVISWERYKPLGATFGMYNLTETAGGRYFLDLSIDEEVILSTSSLYKLYDLGIDYITIDKVGGVVVNKDVVEDGIIVGATEGSDYDVEVYTGTNYKHYGSKADTFAFKAYEIFASTSSQTLQDCFWEVDIPEYFVNGFYDINEGGVIRICREDSFSNETDFSEQLLFPDENEYRPGEFDTIRTYSEVPSLNKFEQTQYPDKLGYKDPDGDGTAEEAEELASKPYESRFKEANVKEYELFFPDGKQCVIEIKSKSGETTGSAIVKFDTGGSKALTYNRFDSVYGVVVNGKGNTGTLTISGFWYDYDIMLTNAEVYAGQDLEAEPVDSSAVSSDSTEVDEAEGTQAETSEEVSEETNEETSEGGSILDKATGALKSVLPSKK